MKEYSLNGLAGLAALEIAESSGVKVGLYVAKQAGIDGGPGNPWVTSCERHSTIMGHSSRKLASAHMSSPEVWCDACKRLVRGRERARKVVAAMPIRELFTASLPVEPQAERKPCPGCDDKPFVTYCGVCGVSREEPTPLRITVTTIDGEVLESLDTREWPEDESASDKDAQRLAAEMVRDAQRCIRARLVAEETKRAASKPRKGTNR